MFERCKGTTFFYTHIYFKSYFFVNLHSPYFVLFFLVQ